MPDPRNGAPTDLISERETSSLRGARQLVDAPDASTVEFRLRRPYAPLLQQLHVVEAPIHTRPLEPACYHALLSRMDTIAIE